MSDDDLKRKQDEVHAKLFAKFEAMLNAAPHEEHTSKLAPEYARLSREAIAEALKYTTDTTSEMVILRAIMLYRSVIQHVRAGGKVHFVEAGVATRVLKVHLKPDPS